MSQVAYEYISSQAERHGVMILSEFAGAAQSLNGSLIINPCERFSQHKHPTHPCSMRCSCYWCRFGWVFISCRSC
jgi:hypothetical protein